MSIEAMKQALEALETCGEDEVGQGFNETEVKQAITSLRQAIAEAEKQEPVAHLKLMMEHSAWEGRLELSDVLANIDEFYTHPQPKREPLTLGKVAELRQKHGITSDGRGIKEFTQVIDFVRDMEAAHGIKENT